MYCLSRWLRPGSAGRLRTRFIQMSVEKRSWQGWYTDDICQFGSGALAVVSSWRVSLSLCYVRAGMPFPPALMLTPLWNYPCSSLRFFLYKMTHALASCFRQGKPKQWRAAGLSNCLWKIVVIHVKAMEEISGHVCELYPFIYGFYDQLFVRNDEAVCLETPVPCMGT